MSDQETQKPVPPEQKPIVQPNQPVRQKPVVPVAQPQSPQSEQRNWINSRKSTRRL